MNISAEEGALKRLSPQKYTIRILVAAVVFLASGIATGWKVYQSKLQTCQDEKVGITERLKDQVINLQAESQARDREQLRRLQAQKDYIDSMNYMYSITQQKAEKKLKNAK